jgi:hypothetical protein
MSTTSAAAETRMKLILNKWRLWAFPVGVLVFVLLTSLLLILPQAGKLLALKNDIEKAQSTLERLVKKRSFLTSVSGQELDNQLLAATRALPNNKPVFAALSAFEGLAVDLGVAVTEYALNPGALEGVGNKPGQLANLPIELTIAGDLPSLNSYVTQLEQLVPVIQVEKVQVSRLRAVSEAFTHESKVAVLVFYSIPPETA